MAVSIAIAIAAVVTATVAAGAVTGTSGDRTNDAKHAIKGGRARNVILFIGDGMGDSEISIARYYAAGAGGHLNMDGLPLTGEYTTYAVQRTDPSKPEYVPDSAATGTAWSTGHKTYNNGISVDPTDHDL